jgi:hypothetical protein
MDPTQAKLLEWAFDKGGAYVVILVLLFFYRRDWQAVLASTKDELAILTGLVVEATKAQSATADALRENNVIVHQAKRVMETYLPLRRDGERGARRANDENPAGDPYDIQR